MFSKQHVVLRRSRFLTAGIVSVLVLCGAACAQDTRQVSEPVIPPICSSLQAHLSSSDGKTLAAADETRLDTVRIQHAIDTCTPGHAVQLGLGGNNNAFLSGPLQLKSGVTLLIAKGITLFGSRDPRQYDLSPGSCGIVDEKGHGCKALINGDHVDNAAVMGKGAIDGRGGEKLLGQQVSWWNLAEQARNPPRSQNCPRILVLLHCNNFTLYRITLRNSANFHVYYGQGNGFTAWGVVINTPKTARNTDGIDPANASNVTITHCFIHAGDDNVAIKAGGTAGPSTNMTIAHNHFYTGHGMSIGSETDAGANHIRVSDLTIDGADNGIRIKSNSSRGGLVEDISYNNICIRNTKNPIFMDSNYSFYGKERTKLPTFRDITLHDVHVTGGGKITLDGYDPTHRLEMHFDDVTLSGDTKISAMHARFTLGPGPVNFTPQGEDVQVEGHATEAPVAASACADKFVPMPE